MSEPRKVANGYMLRQMGFESTTGHLWHHPGLNIYVAIDAEDPTSKIAQAIYNAAVSQQQEKIKEVLGIRE